MPFASPDLPPAPPAYVSVHIAHEPKGHGLSADRGPSPFQTGHTRGISSDSQSKRPDTPPPTAPSSFSPAPFVVANTVNFAREGVQTALTTPHPRPTKVYNTGRASASASSSGSALQEESDQDLRARALAIIVDLRPIFEELLPLEEELANGDADTIEGFEEKEAKIKELTDLKLEKEEELKVIGRKTVRIEAYITKKKETLLQVGRAPKLGKREVLQAQLEQVEATLDDYENPVRGIARAKLLKRQAHLTALLAAHDKHEKGREGIKDLVHARKDVVKIKRGMAKHKPWVESAPAVMAEAHGKKRRKFADHLYQYNKFRNGDVLKDSADVESVQSETVEQTEAVMVEKPRRGHEQAVEDMLRLKSRKRAATISRRYDRGLRQAGEMAFWREVAASKALTEDEMPARTNEFGYTYAELDSEERENGDVAVWEYWDDNTHTAKLWADAYVGKILPENQVDDYLRRQPWIGYRGLGEAEILRNLGYTRVYLPGDGDAS